MKIKSLYLIVLTLCFLAKGKAQLFDSLGSGFTNEIRCAYYDSVFNKLFVTTLDYNTNDGFVLGGVGMWDGSNWDSLQKGFLPNPTWTGDVPSTATSIVRYKDKIYFGGNFLTCNGTTSLRLLVTWDGTQWDSLPFTPPGAVNDMIVWKDTLYICGVFNNIGTDSTIKYVAKWDGSNWHNVGNVFDLIAGGPVLGVFKVYHDELYIGGVIADHSGTPVHLIKWDGFSWSVVGGGINQGGIGMVRALEVFNDELYIGGYFSAAAASGTSSYLTRWDGLEYKDIGGLGMDDACVALCSLNGKLYAGGFFTTINGNTAKSFASFDGSKWCTYNCDINAIEQLSSFKDTLVIIGGYLNSATDSLTWIGLWRGESEINTCITTGIDDFDSETQSLITIYPNPNNGIFTLSTDQIIDRLDIKVLNSLGELFLQSKVLNAFDTTQLDISSQPNGIYLVYLSSLYGSTTLKIIKQ